MAFNQNALTGFTIDVFIVIATISVEYKAMGNSSNSF
jgi:hypothetical protein